MCNIYKKNPNIKQVKTSGSADRDEHASRYTHANILRIFPHA